MGEPAARAVQAAIKTVKEYIMMKRVGIEDASVLKVLIVDVYQAMKMRIV